MWTCPNCHRIFSKSNQPHSCQLVALDSHFKNKAKAKELFDLLLSVVNKKVGKCQIISLPCCIHLFGHYDFLAVLPKKDKLELRFALNYIPQSPKITQSVPLSQKSYKICIDLFNPKDIDQQILDWLSQSFFIKEK